MKERGKCPKKFLMLKHLRVACSRYSLFMVRSRHALRDGLRGGVGRGQARSWTQIEGLAGTRHRDTRVHVQLEVYTSEYRKHEGRDVLFL